MRKFIGTSFIWINNYTIIPNSGRKYIFFENDNKIYYFLTPVELQWEFMSKLEDYFLNTDREDMKDMKELSYEFDINKIDNGDLKIFLTSYIRKTKIKSLLND